MLRASDWTVSVRLFEVRPRHAGDFSDAHGPLNKGTLSAVATIP